jgi:hypothetical protein
LFVVQVFMFVFWSWSSFFDLDEKGESCIEQFVSVTISHTGI